MARPRRRSDQDNQRGTLYIRVTVVVRNNEGRILLVKHNRERAWALPGGQLHATEEPEHRAVLEIAEETGIQIATLQFAGRHAGSVAAHLIYTANGSGQPRPNRRELQDATWWDGEAPLDLQPHVVPILAIANSVATAVSEDDAPSSE